MKMKRTLVSFLLFVVLFAGLAAAAGIGTQTTSDLPSEWTLPATQPGDRGTYVAFQMAGEEVYGPVPYLQWERLPRDTLHDREGISRVVDGLRWTQASWHSETANTWEYGMGAASVSYRDPANQDVIAMDLELLDLTMADAATSPDGLGLIQQRAGGDAQFQIRQFLDPGDPLRDARSCMTDSAAAGTTFSLEEPVVIFDRCILPNLPLKQGIARVDDATPDDMAHLLSAPVHPVVSQRTFAPLGLSPQGELVLEQIEGAPIRVWLSQEIPYPVRLAIPGPNDAWDVFDLTEFQPGTAADRTAVPGADIDLATRTGIEPYGLPDAGMDHPFRPSEAYAIARADDESGPWLETNPNARLVTLSGHHMRATERDDRISWWFQFATADETLTVHVARDMSTAARTTAPTTSILVPDGEVTLAATSPGSLFPGDLLAAPLTAAPHAADLMRIFYDYAGNARGTQVWSLMLTCIDGNTTCEQAAWAATAGVAKTSIDPAVYQDPAIGFEIELLDHGMRFSPYDGQPTSLHEVHVAAASTTGAGTPDAQAPPTDVEPASTDVSWDVPSTTRLVQTGAAAALLAVLYFLWPMLKSVGFGLFSRIHGDAALDHPARADLLAAIEQEPGIHFQELARRTRLGHGATDHHLRKLVEARRVVRHEANGYACYFPMATDRRVMAAAPALRSNTARRTLEAIIDRPGLNGGELAQVLGANRGTVNHHVKRLVDAGVLTATRHGRTVAYEVTQLGLQVAGGRVAA